MYSYKKRKKKKKHKHARLPKTKGSHFLLFGDYFEDSLYYGLSIMYCKCTVSISSLPFCNVLHKSAQSGNYGLVYKRKNVEGKTVVSWNNQLVTFVFYPLLQTSTWNLIGSYRYHVCFLFPLSL